MTDKREQDVKALAFELFMDEDAREIAGQTHYASYDYEAEGGKVRLYWEVIARCALANLTTEAPAQTGLVYNETSSDVTQDPLSITDVTQAQTEAMALAENWQSPEAIPDLSDGSNCYFIVAVRRAHSAKVFTFPAQYLQNYELSYDEEPYEREVTGWYSPQSVDPDMGDTFYQLLSEGDELVGWLAIPEWGETLRQPASVEVEPVALLRDIADEVRDPDGAGTLPTDLMARIDAHLADKVQS